MANNLPNNADTTSLNVTNVIAPLILNPAGEQGVVGPAGPAGPIGPPGSTLTIGTITTLAAGASATASITGTPPSQILNLGIPIGATGTAGASTTLVFGSVTNLPVGYPATASITGIYPHQILNLGIPAGATGAAAVLPQASMGGFIQAPLAKTYIVDLYCPSAYKIVGITIQTLSGTCTAALQLGGVSITGASAIAVTSTIQTISLSQVVAIGNRVTLVLSSLSTPVDLAFSVRIQQ